MMPRSAAQLHGDVSEFVKREVGAKRVIVFDHTIRAQSNVAQTRSEHSTSRRAPVMNIHCDYTENSGPLRVRQLLPDEAEELLKRRVAFYNFWKPLKRAVEERPLAMCDVTSSTDDDFITMKLRYRDRDGEIFVMRYSPQHHWWYFPRMTPDHVIMLKTYDSETDGRARFVGHSRVRGSEHAARRADARKHRNPHHGVFLISCAAPRALRRAARSSACGRRLQASVTRQPGMAAATALPPLAGVIRSRLPWITIDGAVTFAAAASAS